MSHKNTGKRPMIRDDGRDDAVGRGGTVMILRRPNGLTRRRGLAAVQIAVCSTILIGAGAMAVDVGYFWNVRADLQRTADASAMAAAARLSEVVNPAQMARQVAEEYVERNEVMDAVQFTDDSVILGRATLGATGYVVTPVADSEFPDAVTVRLQADGGWIFARIFGYSDRSVQAEATALLIPRDIVIVADLSASHNDDSELGSYADTAINVWDVWGGLPGGSDSAESLWSLEDLEGLVMDVNNFNPQSAGPGYGFFRRMRWGNETIDAGYEPHDDGGLIRLARYGGGPVDGWTNPEIQTYLQEQLFENAAQYSANEITEILNPAHHSSSSRYRRQVAVALGLARWDSGKSGGAWETIPGASAGDGDDRIDSGELVWTEPFLGEGGSEWLNYINWAGSTWSRMEDANPDFRYMFGPKTFTNYLLERHWSNNDTPELADTPHQPMFAVKEAVEAMVDMMESFENSDQLALDVYGYTMQHQVPLQMHPNLTEVSTGSAGLSSMQAGYYDGWTNMGGGLEYGIETLTSSSARAGAHKMMVLLTDGNANINEAGEWPSGSWQDQQRILDEARQYVLAQAQIAADLGIKIFAVSVGVYADTALMDEVATITDGEHLEATSNDISVYQAQLAEIFVRLGGKRPVELIH